MTVLWKKLTFSPHASDHLSGGSDAIKLDDLAVPDDNVDLNASTLKHGLLAKLGGGTANFLRADGTWAEPYTDSEAVAAIQDTGLTLAYDANIWMTDGLIHACRTHFIGPPLSSDQLGDGDIFQGRHDGFDKFRIDKDGNISMVGTVDGVDISGFKYLSVGAPAFVPNLDTNDWLISFNFLRNRVTTEAQSFYAPVFLPHGATISRLTLFGERTSAQADMTLRLYRSDNTGGFDEMAEIIADWSTGTGSGYDDTIDYATISNTSYSYCLALILDPKSAVADVMFFRAQINLA